MKYSVKLMSNPVPLVVESDVNPAKALTDAKLKGDAFIDFGDTVIRGCCIEYVRELSENPATFISGLKVDKLMV